MNFSESLNKDKVVGERIQSLLVELRLELDAVLPGVADSIVVKEDKNQVIPETGISGQYNSTNKEIIIYFDPDSGHLKNNLLNEVRRTLSHEYMHAYRERFHRWDEDSVFECLFAEGLTQNFESQMFPELQPAPYSTSVSSSDLLVILGKVNADEKFNYYDLFFGNSDLSVPAWAGYSLSYLLVKEYCKSKGSKPSELAQDNVIDFTNFCKSYTMIV